MKTLPTICFLTGTLNAFAGAERMTAVIANALAERGYPVLILSLWDERSCFALHPAVRHHALFAQRPSFKRAYLATVSGIRRFVRRHGIDVLIDVDTMLTLFTLPATLGLNVRRIAWEHCHFDEDLGKPARRIARRLAARFDDAVVVLTERDRQRWLTALAPRCRVEAIPNPLPFPFPEVPASRDSKTVLAVGRLVHAKGFDVLLNAWAWVAPRHPDWRLEIVGEGEERQALEISARNLGIESSVSMLGISASIDQCYKNAAIFCLSSRYEGFGLVLLEAMAFALPVVSTNCKVGPRELLCSNDDSLVVPVNDNLALASALSHLITDHDDGNRLGRAARKKAETYSLIRIAGQWEFILRPGRL
ncbi:glycosyltransferase family 4 protein [Cupriavidus sp. WS]|uniref:glycosyltransferase family 4 protein n=1 Tax=Cupriavidus sp. WS TaxID=1312922 RepID=UPI00037DC558|nr:glycosyltransferase family 4 protein [Cupriavidus sp. WS]